MLKVTSRHAHAYYCGDLPGNLQYNKDPEELLGLVLPEDHEDPDGFRLCEHSMENLQRVTPYTRKNINWKILLMMTAERDDGRIILKAALQDRVTGKIALLSSVNDKKFLDLSGHRAVKTVDGTWFVGHFRMCAPVVFWKELQNRLKY